jgi:hypothetical protein
MINTADVERHLLQAKRLATFSPVKFELPNTVSSAQNKETTTYTRSELSKLSAYRSQLYNLANETNHYLDKHGEGAKLSPILAFANSDILSPETTSNGGM